MLDASSSSGAEGWVGPGVAGRCAFLLSRASRSSAGLGLAPAKGLKAADVGQVSGCQLYACRIFVTQ